MDFCWMIDSSLIMNLYYPNLISFLLVVYSKDISLRRCWVRVCMIRKNFTSIKLDKLGSPIFFISMIYDIDMSLPLEILKLQNLIVWSNWSIFYLNNSLLTDELVFINYYFYFKKYLHNLSGCNQFTLSLAPWLLLKC